LRQFVEGAEKARGVILEFPVSFAIISGSAEYFPGPILFRDGFLTLFRYLQHRHGLIVIHCRSRVRDELDDSTYARL
jgi:hypothetical protein